MAKDKLAKELHNAIVVIAEKNDFDISALAVAIMDTKLVGMTHASALPEKNTQIFHLERLKEDLVAMAGDLEVKLKQAKKNPNKK